MAFPARKNETGGEVRPLQGASATPLQRVPARTTPVAAREPEAIRVPSAPMHVAPVLWTLLGLSVLFLVGVQIYVHRVEQSVQATAQDVPGLPLMSAFGPLDAVPRNDLELRWDSVSGAVTYELHILTDRGAPVLDPAEVWSTTWRPTDQLMPALTRGTYRWSVEALDSSGNVLARSVGMEFGIL